VGFPHVGQVCVPELTSSIHLQLWSCLHIFSTSFPQEGHFPSSRSLVYIKQVPHLNIHNSGFSGILAFSAVGGIYGAQPSDATECIRGLRAFVYACIVSLSI